MTGYTDSGDEQPAAPPPGPALDARLELRPMLDWFSQRQEARLRTHDADRGPEGWLTAPPRQLHEWLRYYDQKLQQAVAENDRAGIIRHAESVGNLAGMLAQRAAVESEAAHE